LFLSDQIGDHVDCMFGVPTALAGCFFNFHTCIIAEIDFLVNSNIVILGYYKKSNTQVLLQENGLFCQTIF
jgi:hypothetical protein